MAFSQAFQTQADGLGGLTGGFDTQGPLASFQDFGTSQDNYLQFTDPQWIDVRYECSLQDD